MKHQTPTPSGTRAHIRIAGVLHTRHFPTGTPQQAIRRWLLETELKYRTRPAQRTGRLRDDAEVYLQTVAGMPTYTQRKQHIDQWVAALGHLRRDAITPAHILGVIAKWQAEKLAPATINKRRTALMHLYSRLDGKADRNIVRDVPRLAEPTPAPRAIPFDALAGLFAAMPDSKSKARLMVVAYTGMPPGIVGQLKPEDVDLTAKVVARPGRKKGAGTQGRLVPLIPHAVAAFKLFRKEEAWGAFTSAPIGRVLKRALRRVGLPESFRVYDLRHSFGTEVYRRTGDIRATQGLLDHASPTLTNRYILGAVDPRQRAAVESFNASFQTPKKPRKSR